MIASFLKKSLTRLEVLKSNLPEVPQKAIRIQVYRNHAFESMEGLLKKFLAASGLQVTFDYSDYDDSFNFQESTNPIDLNIIWIDFSHYKISDISSWFQERIQQLKTRTARPIFVYYMGLNSLKVDGAFSANSNAIQQELKEVFYDYEKAEYSGTNLSAKALVKIAQELGLKYIPSFFKTPIKAVMVDLDNTLYSGVLGEDGTAHVIPNQTFQQQLKTLKNEGVLLAFVSKNQYEDARKLFEKRTDFVLKWDDFSSHHASWGSKAVAIEKITKQFNIGLDSVLFVDDNPGEIQQVKQCLPQVHTLLADEELCYKFNLYPLLKRYQITQEDSLRQADIQASQQRAALKQTLDENAYFKQLQMVLSFHLDNTEHFDRAIQLLNKTNQFIFSFKRYAAEAIRKDQHILTIKLKDTLSDSGIIGVIVAAREVNCLKIDELVISCRALGRQIETIMLDIGFQYLAEQLKTTDDVLIDFVSGPRNLPAKTWLEQYTNCLIAGNTEIQTKIKAVEVNPFITIQKL